MFLKNYDYLMALRSKSVTSSTSAATQTLDGGALNVRGQNAYFLGVNHFLPLTSFEKTNNTYPTKAGSTTLCVGSGSTPVTYDDYKLENQISGLSCVSIGETASVLTDDGTAFETTLTVIYSNLNSTSITINEIGCYWTTGGNNEGYTCLVYREVLENSIEVPAQANVVITFKKKVSIYPNKPVEAETDVGVFKFTELSEYKAEGSHSGYEYEYITLVSDTVLTEEQLKNATFTYVDEDGVERTTSFGNDDCDFMSMELDNGNFLAITDADGEQCFIASVPYDNASIQGGWTFPKAGTYFSVWVDTANNNEFLFGVKKMTLAADTN